MELEYVITKSDDATGQKRHVLDQMLPQHRHGTSNGKQRHKDRRPGDGKRRQQRHELNKTQRDRHDSVGRFHFATVAQRQLDVHDDANDAGKATCYCDGRVGPGFRALVALAGEVAVAESRRARTAEEGVVAVGKVAPDRAVGFGEVAVGGIS